MVHSGRVNSSPLNSQHSLFQLFQDVSITFTISLPLSLASSSSSFLPPSLSLHLFSPPPFLFLPPCSISSILHTPVTFPSPPTNVNFSTSVGPSSVGHHPSMSPSLRLF